MTTTTIHERFKSVWLRAKQMMKDSLIVFSFVASLYGFYSWVTQPAAEPSHRYELDITIRFEVPNPIKQPAPSRRPVPTLDRVPEANELHFLHHLMENPLLVPIDQGITS